MRHNPLSITLDELPPNTPYFRYTPIPHHGLIVVRDGVTYGALVDAYVRNLPPRLRRRLFAAAGVADPIDTPCQYHRDTPWWQRDRPVTPDGVYRMERSGLITPWPHAWLT
ncbi:hypothetical protein [Nocardiopsis oceani]